MPADPQPDQSSTSSPEPINSPVENALRVFDLTLPITSDELEIRYRNLLRTWHPHRYASLTNNPKKYMEMYEKGETMSKDIQEAYKILVGCVSKPEMPR